MLRFAARFPSRVESGTRPTIIVDAPATAMDTAVRRPPASWRSPVWRNAALRRTAYVLLFALFLGVRAYHLELQPPHNATTDEYAWTWSGMTLLRTGRPRAWSNLAAYADRREVIDWRDHKYKMVEPWLDHPPLYSLYAGAWMRAQGYRKIFDVDLWHMRTGSLPLAALSFGSLALVLRHLVTPGAALLALLFYAIMPAMVWHQRLVISENLSVPLTLSAVLLVLQQRRTFSNWRTLALLVLALLLPLTKVAALSSSVFLALWALACPDNPRTRWLCCGAVVSGTCLGIAGYLAHGYRLDAELFTKVLTNHEDRFLGFAGMEILLFEPQLINKPVRDLLSVTGCVFALASLRQPRLAPWGLAVLVYAACMAFFVNQRRVFGWYFIPLYPWICAALGATIVQASRERARGLSLLWCSAAWLTVASTLYQHKLLSENLVRYGYLAGLLGLCGVWFAWPRAARWTLPPINGLCVAAVSAACLYEIYIR